MLLFETISLDLFLVKLYFLIISPFCCPDSAGYMSSFNSNVTYNHFFSCSVIFLCIYVPYTWRWIVPWKAEREAWMICFLFAVLLFSLHVFSPSETDVLTSREQRWVSFSENAMHGNHVNISLVTFILLLRWLFFRYKWDWVWWT